MSKTRHHCRPTIIYTDKPARVSALPGGLIDHDKPCNMFVTWATTHSENPPAESTLSIRWAYNGPRYLESDKERYAVDDTCYHIFNYGQRFGATIDSPVPVDCYSLLIEPGFAEETLRSLVTPADKLLDEPRSREWQSVHFHERTYRHDAILSPLLFRMQRGCESEGATHGWFEEQFHQVVLGMLEAHRNIRCEIARMPAVRASTRVELYERLHRARDYMEANLYDPISLHEIAEAAWFSPHHFLRLFKQTFRETPHQYLTRRRLERAQQLLLKSDLSVTEICTTLGFESLGSFSWLFRRHLGLSPDAFRRENRTPFVGLLPPMMECPPARLVPIN